MKYYVMPKNQLGDRQVISESEGTPTHMTGVDIVELPRNNGLLRVISRGKDYPVSNIARAIAAGQIKIEDVK